MERVREAWDPRLDYSKNLRREVTIVKTTKPSKWLRTSAELLPYLINFYVTNEELFHIQVKRMCLT